MNRRTRSFFEIIARHFIGLQPFDTVSSTKLLGHSSRIFNQSLTAVLCELENGALQPLGKLTAKLMTKSRKRKKLWKNLDSMWITCQIWQFWQNSRHQFCAKTMCCRIQLWANLVSTFLRSNQAGQSHAFHPLCQTWLRCKGLEQRWKFQAWWWSGSTGRKHGCSGESGHRGWRHWRRRMPSAQVVRKLQSVGRSGWSQTKCCCDGHRCPRYRCYLLISNLEGQENNPWVDINISILLYVICILFVYYLYSIHPLYVQRSSSHAALALRSLWYSNETSHHFNLAFMLSCPVLLMKWACIQLHLWNLHWMHWMPGKLVTCFVPLIALIAASCRH